MLCVHTIHTIHLYTYTRRYIKNDVSPGLWRRIVNLRDDGYGVAYVVALAGAAARVGRLRVDDQVMSLHGTRLQEEADVQRLLAMAGTTPTSESVRLVVRRLVVPDAVPEPPAEAGAAAAATE